MVEVRVVPTDQLSRVELRALRGLLDNAFEDGFTDDDWDHTVGGLMCSRSMTVSWLTLLSMNGSSWLRIVPFERATSKAWLRRRISGVQVTPPS